MMDAPPEPLPLQEQRIMQSLVDCGLKAGGFTVKYEDYLQSIEIVITPAAGATPDHFACIRQAAFPEIVTFVDRALYQQYMAYETELVRPQILAELETSLKQSGLWDGFPEREDYGSLQEYARALEVHAGIEPGTALRVEGSDRLIYDPPRPDTDFAGYVERYANILTVAAFAAAREQIDFGIIGNEKYRE